MFFADTGWRGKLARYAPLPLRLHGARLRQADEGSDAFVAIVQAMGVPAPFLMAWLTILVELLGGFAVLLGAFVVPLSAPMAAVLLVAAFTVHLPFGFTSIKLLAITSSGPQFGPPGYETDLLYLACLAALLMGGSGPWAADNEIARWLRGTPKKSGGSMSDARGRTTTGADAVASHAEAGRADR
jgi:putative oxidoreductase